ncbi:MAG: SEC-C metal-binding domain-containing protein [Flavicella sp.]
MSQAALKSKSPEQSCCSNSSCCGSNESYERATPKIGRNNPCPCGSGRKYKKCCG